MRSTRSSGRDTPSTGLLTREEFGVRVFARDHHRCVLCGSPAVDAHHLIERRLFADGGYYLDNGVSVCAEDHMRCERTDVSVEDVRRAAGIERVVVPPGFDPTVSVDKWGNVVREDGTRLMGPLFERDGVQKAIASHLHLFVG